MTIFIASCFGIANDSEAPESWLEWTSGWRKLVFGINAHRRWHWTRGEPPVRHVRWYCRSIGAPVPETVMNLWYSFWAWVTCSEPPWVIEAREAAEEEADAKQAAESAAAPEAGGDKPSESPVWSVKVRTSESAAYEPSLAASSGPGSLSSSRRSAMELQAYTRRVMVYGLVGTVIAWTLFVWCVCGCWLSCACGFQHSPMPHRFIFTYGMLVYRLLGEDAESQFARSWGISYGLNAATEWKDIAIEAAKAAVILLILERLFLTRNGSWLEVRRAPAGARRRSADDAFSRTGAHRLPKPAGAAVQGRQPEPVSADAPVLRAHEAPHRLATLATYVLVYSKPHAHALPRHHQCVAPRPGP